MYGKVVYECGLQVPNVVEKIHFLLNEQLIFIDKLLKDCASYGGRYEIYLSSFHGHSSVLISIINTFFTIINFPTITIS